VARNPSKALPGNVLFFLQSKDSSRALGGLGRGGSKAKGKLGCIYHAVEISNHCAATEKKAQFCPKRWFFSKFLSSEY